MSDEIKILTASTARYNFWHMMGDVAILLKTHDAETKRAAGRPDRSLEVFKRTGVILTVTAWEAYIEDTLTEQFNKRLKEAVAPVEISGTFNSVAQAWLNSRPKPPDVSKWIGTGWKDAILEKFQHDVLALNTPSSENLKVLFERYLDLDITKHWKWRNTSSSKACQKLDALIRLRGELVHRGKNLFELKDKVRRSDLVDARHLTEKLVECTDIALKIAPEET